MKAKQTLWGLRGRFNKKHFLHTEPDNYHVQLLKRMSSWTLESTAGHVATLSTLVDSMNVFLKNIWEPEWSIWYSDVGVLAMIPSVNVNVFLWYPEFLATKGWIGHKRGLADECNPMAAFAVILALMWSSNRCNCNFWLICYPITA